jgi:hypothetical protein
MPISPRRERVLPEQPIDHEPRARLVVQRLLQHDDEGVDVYRGRGFGRSGNLRSVRRQVERAFLIPPPYQAV